MKAYVVWADTWNAPYGCQVTLFGVYSERESAKDAINGLEKEKRTGATGYPLYYYIAELDMNKQHEVYLDGYYE